MLLALTAGAAAQDYPTKPVRLIIPFPPGGSNDVVGRMIATQLSEQLGKQVVVDNRARRRRRGRHRDRRPRRRPTATRCCIISIAHAVNPWLYKLPYDPIKAFAPVAHPRHRPQRAGGQSRACRSTRCKELVALAKQKPGELQYASAGIGSFQHLGGELFKLTAGVDILHVPFKGGGPAMIDVIGGHTKIMFSSLVQTTPHIRSGKLRALGTGGAKRNPVLPDVPTIAEAGVPELRGASTGGASWRRPARRPPIVEKLHTEISRGAGHAETCRSSSPTRAPRSCR